MIAVGGSIPVAVATNVTTGDSGTSFAAVADGVVVIPAASYDYALDDRHYIGVEVSLLNSVTAEGSSGGAFGLFVNPRWEMGVTDHISVGVDLNLGYFTDGDTGVPFIGPSFGGRFYIPTGFGGFVVSQNISTAFITLALPGSVAYDFPIPLGETSKLHIFPEFRWDPTFIFVEVSDNAVGGIVSLFSAGLTLMFEI